MPSYLLTLRPELVIPATVVIFYVYKYLFVSYLFEDDILSNTYESVKKLAKDQGLAVYPMTKEWFLARFSSEEEGFDMNAGREKITN